MKKYITKFPIVLLCLATLIGCNDFETDLDVPNLEHPNDIILNSDPIALEGKAGSMYRNYFMALTSTSGPGFALNVAADVSTCSHGNFAMWNFSEEPRTTWNNSPSYSYQDITNSFFNSMYSVLFDANTLVYAINNDIDFDNPALIEAIARFNQALAIGYNALIFDKVWLSDENGSVGEEAVGYQEAMAFALEKLDQGIQIAQTNSFEVPASWIPGNTLSSADLAKLMSSYGARMMVMNVRNSNEKAALDWNKVLSYANNGITQDFSIEHDDVNWYDLFKTYTVYPGWGRVDLRIINMMDPNTPNHWPEGATILPQATSADARLETDFQYLSSQNFRAERGSYHYSNYRYARLNDYITEWTIPTVEFSKTELDLYKAEALVNIGNDIAGAANIINTGTRVTRGNLPLIAETAAAVKAAIHYERMIELPISSVGISFFEMRKEDLLQKGTPLHFPIPGKALESIPAPNYTYGGTTGVPGIDYSTGGWR